MGFGVKHFVQASFEGAPEGFYDLVIKPVGQSTRGVDGPYEFASLPPWEKKGTAQKPTKRAATQPGTYSIKPGLSLVIAESPRGKLDRSPTIEAQLIWQQPGETKPSHTHDIRLSEGMPYAIAWREDGEVFWVRCSAKLGSGTDERVNHYLRVLTVRAPGEVDEKMADLENPPADLPKELLDTPPQSDAVKPSGADVGFMPLPAGLSASNSLPGFWAENAGGQIVKLEDKGIRGRWVLVEFWSLADRKRVETEQSLQRLRRQFEADDRLLIWSVCVEEDRGEWMKEISARPDLANADGSTKKFPSDHRWWQLILGRQSDAQWRAFLVRIGLSDLPQYFLINPEGNLAGRVEPSKLVETLSRLLADTAGRGE
jgi:hypothetical protein